MQIVPALYIKDGKLAVYKPGDYKNIEFLEEDPYDFIEMLGNLPVQRIRLVDIDAHDSTGEKNNFALLGSLANTSVPLLEVGGGIQDMDQLKSLQYGGVDYFILGSAIFEDPDFLKDISEADDVKNDKILIAIDIIDGNLTYHGWKEKSNHSLEEVIQKIHDWGFTRFIVTDTTTDKEELGPNIELYKSLVRKFPNCLFGAAGRINTFEDIYQLKDAGVDEVVIGNKIYKQEGLLKRIVEFNEAEEE